MCKAIDDMRKHGEDVMKLAMIYRYEKGCDTVEKLVNQGIPKDVAIKALS